MEHLESMTVGAAAERLQVGQSTVRRWMQSGRLTGHKVERGGPGGTWIVDRASVERLAAERGASMSTPTAATVNTRLLAEVEALRAEVRRLSEQIGAMQKALPEGDTRRPWWRLWR